MADPLPQRDRYCDHAASCEAVQPTQVLPMHVVRPGVQDQTFVDSQGALSGIARLGTVDCNAADATGKPIVQRLRLRTRKSPVAFTTGNGMRPRQVPPAKFKSVDRLVAYVHPGQVWNQPLCCTLT